MAEAGNQTPVLDPIGPQTVAEASNLNITVTASDPDATIPTLTTSALPTGASFVDNGDGTGSFTWTPDFTQSGSYPVTFSANDGADTTTELVTITVNNVNQVPVLDPIGAQSTDENVELSFRLSIVWMMSAIFSASQYVGRIIATCELVFVPALFMFSSAYVNEC